MLQGLAALLARSDALDRLDEAALYRSEKHHRRPAGALQRARHRHGTLICPICGFQGLGFDRFGLDRRRNAQCPGCGSLERHRFLWLVLTHYGRHLGVGGINGWRRVLHTAPEACLTMRLRARIGRGYRSIDRFDPAADLRADLTALPLPSGSLDAVLSCHTLEHIPDDRAALAELARVLRPGGTLVLMVPYDNQRAATDEDPSITSPAERLARFGHPYHYRIYGRDLVQRLAAAGFTVQVLHSKRLLPPQARRRWRINRCEVFVAVKR